MPTTTQPKTALVNGKKYKIESVADMSVLPGMSEHIRDIYVVSGPRGAAYTLQVYHNGTFELFDSKWRTKTSGEWK